MTTKELIKLLQEEDPSGECHVRVGSGYPTWAERKEGYWDGPYMYEKDGKLHYSTKGMKVDIHTNDLEDWTTNLVDRDNTISDDEIKEKIVFELGYVENSEREEKFLENAKKYANEMRGIIKQVKQWSLWDIMSKIKDGWSIHFTGKINWYYKKGIKKEGMGCGVGNMVMTCGFFEEFKKNQWRLKQWS